MSSDLQPIIINLSQKDQILSEGFLSIFGDAIKLILGSMFDKNTAIPVRIVGTTPQVSALAKALAREKKYMETYVELGLNDSKTFRSRHALNTAVAQFERETGIKWPFVN
jgi:hypothetical protein